MPVLERIADLALRPPARAAYEKLSFELAEHDSMFAGNPRHYLQCGASALSVIHAAATLAGTRPGSILDFGAGAGRVTRWLRAQWPKARLAATDLTAADVEFCARTFDCTSWVCTPDIDALAAPARYDIIWVGSVLTHLDAARAVALLGRLLSWTRPQGLVIASLHGRQVLERAPAHAHYGLTADGWAALLQAHAATGYGFADYPDTPGYGISVASPSWAVRLPALLPATRLALFGEALWDGHHDVIALQREADADSAAEETGPG